MIEVSEQVIMVTVNGKEYPTRLYNGVQRFVPNEIVQYMNDAVLDAFMNKKDTLGIDLNSLGIKLRKRELPLQDYIEYLTMIGYSVSGFCDAVYSIVEFNDHIFQGDTEDWLTIENPLWDN